MTTPTSAPTTGNNDDNDNVPLPRPPPRHRRHRPCGRVGARPRTRQRASDWEQPQRPEENIFRGSVGHESMQSGEPSPSWSKSCTSGAGLRGARSPSARPQPRARGQLPPPAPPHPCSVLPGPPRPLLLPAPCPRHGRHTPDANPPHRPCPPHPPRPPRPSLLPTRNPLKWPAECSLTACNTTRRSPANKATGCRPGTHPPGPHRHHPPTPATDPRSQAAQSAPRNRTPPARSCSRRAGKRRSSS